MQVLRAYARGDESGDAAAALGGRYAAGAAPGTPGGDARGRDAPSGAIRGPRGVIAVLRGLTRAARFWHRLVVVDGGAIVVDGPPERALTAETLKAHYRVTAHFGFHEGEPLIVPWRPLV